MSDGICPIYHCSTDMSPRHPLYELLDRLDGILHPPKYYHGIQSANTALCLSYQTRGNYWDNTCTFKDVYLLDVHMKIDVGNLLDVDRRIVYCMPECVFGLLGKNCASLYNNQPCLMQFGNMNRGYFVRHVLFQKYESSPTHCWETEDGEYLMLPEFEIEHLSLESLRLLGF